MNHLMSTRNITLSTKSDINNYQRKTPNKLMYARCSTLPLIDLKSINSNNTVYSNKDGIYFRTSLLMESKFDTKYLSEVDDIYENWPTIPDLGDGYHDIINFLSEMLDCDEECVIKYLRQYRGN